MKSQVLHLCYVTSVVRLQGKLKLITLGSERAKKTFTSCNECRLSQVSAPLQEHHVG